MSSVVKSVAKTAVFDALKEIGRASIASVFEATQQENFLDTDDNETIYTYATDSEENNESVIGRRSRPNSALDRREGFERANMEFRERAHTQEIASIFRGASPSIAIDIPTDKAKTPIGNNNNNNNQMMRKESVSLKKAPVSVEDLAKLALVATEGVEQTAKALLPVPSKPIYRKRTIAALIMLAILWAVEVALSVSQLIIGGYSNNLAVDVTEISTGIKTKGGWSSTNNNVRIVYLILSAPVLAYSFYFVIKPARFLSCYVCAIVMILEGIWCIAITVIDAVAIIGSRNSTKCNNETVYSCTGPQFIATVSMDVLMSVMWFVTTYAMYSYADNISGTSGGPQGMAAIAALLFRRPGQGGAGPTQCKYCKRRFRKQESLEKHEGHCPDRTTMCRYCTLHFKEREIEAHYLACDFRSVTCPHCRTQVLFKNELEHVNQCLQMRMQQQQQQQHIHEQQHEQQAAMRPTEAMLAPPVLKKKKKKKKRKVPLPLPPKPVKSPQQLSIAIPNISKARPMPILTPHATRRTIELQAVADVPPVNPHDIFASMLATCSHCGAAVLKEEIKGHERVCVKAPARSKEVIREILVREVPPIITNNIVEVVHNVIEKEVMMPIREIQTQIKLVEVPRPPVPSPPVLLESTDSEYSSDDDDDEYGYDYSSSKIGLNDMFSSFHEVDCIHCGCPVALEVYDEHTAMCRFQPKICNICGESVPLFLCEQHLYAQHQELLFPPQRNDTDALSLAASESSVDEASADPTPSMPSHISSITETSAESSALPDPIVVVVDPPRSPTPPPAPPTPPRVPTPEPDRTHEPAMIAQRNRLGFGAMFVENRNGPGCKIVQVTPGSMADTAGLCPGMIVTHLDTMEVSNPRVLELCIKNARRTLSVEAEVPVTLCTSDGSEFTIILA